MDHGGGHHNHAHHAAVTPAAVQLLADSTLATGTPAAAFSSRSLHADMMMFFHGGYNETILFEGWTIDSIGGLVGSMVGIFLMCLLYEGLKFYREHLMRQSYSTLPYNNVPSAGTEHGDSPAPDDRPNRRREVVKIIQTEVFSVHHFLQTFLQMVQIILSYFLMLIFMTFNSWLCGAVVAGLTVGYFLFGWRKAVVVDSGDHCH